MRKKHISSISLFHQSSHNKLDIQKKSYFLISKNNRNHRFKEIFPQKIFAREIFFLFIRDTLHQVVVVDPTQHVSLSLSTFHAYRSRDIYHDFSSTKPKRSVDSIKFTQQNVTFATWIRNGLHFRFFVAPTTIHACLESSWVRILRDSDKEKYQGKISNAIRTALSAVSPLYRPTDANIETYEDFVPLFRMDLIGSGNEINCGVIGMKFSIENFFYREPLDVILNICLSFFYRSKTKSDGRTMQCRDFKLLIIKLIFLD